MENNTLDLMTALDKDDSRVQKIKEKIKAILK